MYLTEKWEMYSNHKALLENAGQEGKLYPNFTDFKVKEIRQIIGARMMHGLAPAPRIQMKSRSQADDDVNGNNFISRCVGPNATRRYSHFKRFFAVQNSVVKVMPKREEDPNWKDGDFLAWILTV